MKTLLYSFGLLAILLSPATCNLDTEGNIIVGESVSTETAVGEEAGSDNSNADLHRKNQTNDNDIDPILIRTKP